MPGFGSSAVSPDCTAGDGRRPIQLPGARGNMYMSRRANVRPGHGLMMLLVLQMGSGGR